MQLTQLTAPADKQSAVRSILEALPDWFGIPEAREAYIRKSADQPCVAAMEGDTPVGVLCLKPTGKATVEIAVMGVLPRLHRQGVGRQLVEQAKQAAREMGYAFMQVKTVEMGRYDEYDRTNRFYLSMGFQEFEVFPTLWDEWNPCQVYVLSLADRA